ncbi:MAG: aminotransferase class I/II-fold pyridoxal phosphate-dependent enzyme, partial [Acidobacteriota bacterium]
PTWPHPGPVDAPGGPRRQTYPYYDAPTPGLDFEARFSSLAAGVEAGDFVLIHGCCHNPTGVDLSAEQWRQLASLLSAKGAVPVVDFAYQGFVAGADEDAAPIRALASSVPEMVVCTSFSKNLGLYAERVGAITLMARDADQASAVMSQLKRTIRSLYSNPPNHGASVVALVLGDGELRGRWRRELAGMRERIQAMRELFAGRLTDRGVSLSEGGNDFIKVQNGMFSFSGLSKAQVLRLRDDFGVYMVDSGRLNVAGITESNVDYLVEAIAAVA